MSDLTQSQWNAVIAASLYLPQDGSRHVGRYIALDKLREIIKKSKRSNDQNALLWALYDDILHKGGETLGGWTSADLHDAMLGTHFGWDRYEAFGMVKQKPRKRSSRLTKSEFSDFLETVVRTAAEQGIVVSLPGEQAA